MKTQDKRPDFLTEQQLGVSQSLTPEGFLLCKGVPLSRLGEMLYADSELPELEAGRDGLIRVTRGEDAVFDERSISSWNGKPVTDDHPPEEITPDNWSVYAKGTVHNPRRGDGAQSDLLVGDLLITDRDLIEKVRSKKKTEVSGGYDAEYEQDEPGSARQVAITGNHVAVVKNGRCGPVCAVQDGDGAMTHRSTRTWKDRIRSMIKAGDEAGIEEELERADKEMKDEETSGMPEIHVHLPGSAQATAEEPKVQDEETTQTAPDPIAELRSMVEALTAEVAKMKQAEVAEANETLNTDEEPCVEGDDPAKKVTMDSTSLSAEFKDLLSKAEVLCPGVRLPTFDARATVKNTRDAMCSLRRQALSGAKDEAVRRIVGGRDVGKMTCDSLEVVFDAATELARQHTNDSVARKTTPGDLATSNLETRKTVSEINKNNREFWKRQ